jgi:hypothetical protein
MGQVPSSLFLGVGRILDLVPDGYSRELVSPDAGVGQVRCWTLQSFARSGVEFGPKSHHSVLERKTQVLTLDNSLMWTHDHEPHHDSSPRWDSWDDVWFPLSPRPMYGSVSGADVMLRPMVAAGRLLHPRAPGRQM